MAFQGVGERNGAPENIAQQQKRLRLVNVRPILSGCYAELRLGRDIPKRKPDNSDRVSRKKKAPVVLARVSPWGIIALIIASVAPRLSIRRRIPEWSS
jgi:hypothetical protein